MRYIDLKANQVSTSHLLLNQQSESDLMSDGDGYFLGIRFDIGHISNDNNKKEFELSLYSSMFGIDLYYRQTGNDYKIREAYLGNGLNSHTLKGIPFSGLTVGIKGFDLYYIFNHKKFSYPAAFSKVHVRNAAAALRCLA